MTPVQLVPVGPLTNIALALERNAAAMARIGRLADERVAASLLRIGRLKERP